MDNLNEGREQIKRKYGEYGAIKVNENAPIRNEILRFVNKRFVTEEEMKQFLTKMSENRGKDLDARQWFSRNGRYFEKFENRGQEVWTLSKYGKRVLEFIKKSDSSQGKLNESIGLFKFETMVTESDETFNFDEIDGIFEAGPRRTADEVNREAERRLKEQITRYSELMKSNPDRADIYKAQLDLANARMMVVAMKKKLDQVKKKM
jgi:hypothetical protein